MATDPIDKSAQSAIESSKTAEIDSKSEGNSATARLHRADFLRKLTH